MPRVATHRPGRTALLAALLLSAGGCATDSADAASQLPAAFADGVPAPEGDVVLTLRVAGEDVVWDVDTLEQLEQVELSMLEPFVLQQHTFTGPLLRDVLVASGVDLERAVEVELVALDEFVAVIPLDDASLDGAVLATTAQGGPIEIADGGPIRLVFDAENPTGENLNNWIWSIVEGVVR